MSRRIVYYGPSMSGKTTEGIRLMSSGMPVFDTDWIYGMFHLKSQDFASRDEFWRVSHERFVELFRKTNGLLGYNVFFTADIRSFKFLKEQGFICRTMSTVYGDHTHNRSMEVL